MLNYGQKHQSYKSQEHTVIQSMCREEVQLRWFGQVRVLTRRAQASTWFYEVRGISEGGNKLKLVASLTSDRPRLSSSNL